MATQSLPTHPHYAEVSPFGEETPVLQNLKMLLRSEDGATAVEYGLILALIFLAMIAAVQGVGNSTIGMWNTIKNTSATAIAQSSV